MTTAISEGMTSKRLGEALPELLEVVEHRGRPARRAPTRGGRRTTANGSRPRPRSDSDMRGAVAPAGSSQDRHGVRGDRLDLLRRALELVVGEHRRALEGQVAVEVDPGAAALILGPDLDGHRTRDPVGAQHDHVQRVAPLPGQPLLGVVAGPDVVRRQGVDRARIGDQVARRHLGPGPDPHAVGLRDAAVLDQRLGGRLAVGPHALLERALELGHVRLADQVVALVVEGRIEEEAIVLDLEVLVLLANAALAQGEQLLTLGERAHGYSPFLDSYWHRGGTLQVAPV